jgi:WD40 repeat protein
MSDQPKVFISYARQDGEEFATVLRRRLEREEPEITLWQDRAQMEGGVGWWKQVTDALDVAQFLILVMTPAALQSPITRKEWRYARQQGVCVFPVKGVPDAAIDFASLPRWMQKAHFFDLEREWATFVNYLKSPCQVARVPFMAPDLPDGFVERPALFAQLLQILLDAERQNLALTTALHGAGGLGKTTLAAALCHHDEIIAMFDDGILWVTLGRQPNVYEGLAKLYAALTGERPGFIDKEDVAFHLAERLEGKNCLIVIDDIWDAADLRLFMQGGKDCVRLITTRIFDIAAEAVRCNVDEMTTPEAVQMLTSRLECPSLDLAPLRELADRLDRWPLMLELASAALRHRIHRGDTLAGALDYLNRKLDKQGVVAFDNRNSIERQQAIASTIEVSLEPLDAEERRHCVELAIFPEDTIVPLRIMSALWALDDFDAEELAQRLDNLSLLKFSLQTATIHLHDVIRAYLTTQLREPAALHARLVDSWGDPHHLSHAYAWRWLPYHLMRAGRAKDLRQLLLDYEWLQAKLEATDAIALLTDYDYIPDDEDLHLVQGAIRLCTHVVAADKTQLAGQLLGRLPIETSARINALRQQAERWQGVPWLRPLTPLLTSPGGALLFTLAGHTGRVRAVAITSDGQRAISASDDQTVKVWDLERGAEERTLTGHADWVRAVAVIPNGLRAISASDDHTLKIWDIETGAAELTIDTYGDWVWALAVTPDGRYAISASDDRTLKIWDLERGTVERMLKGHSAEVNAVAVAPDGRVLVSGSDDRTLRVWDLSRGTEVGILKGHTAKVNAVAVTPNGRHAISASADDTLRVWELEQSGAAQPRTVTARAYRVRGLAVTPDGRRVITAFEDYTLKVWDLEHEVEERSLEGHTDWVNAVAVTPDGRYAVSASDDHTLKVWDLSRVVERRTFRVHTDRVRAVMVMPDGRRAISTSDDHTLRVWDMALGIVERTLTSYNHWVVTVAPDGRRIISASSHATLRVWDFESGSEQCTFMKHTDRIRAVSVTPDGRHVISAGDDRTIRVWDIETGAEELRIDVQVHWIRGLAVTPDGRYALSASDRRALKLWNLADGSEERTFRGHTARVNAVTITPNGHFAISASDDHTLRVWNIEEAVEQHMLTGHTARVGAVAITRDGQYAISASDDCTLRVWDLEKGQPVASFTGESPLLTCAVSPCERTVVAGDQSGWVHFLCLESVA